MSDPNLVMAVNGGPDNRYRLEMTYDEFFNDNPRTNYESLWHLRFAGRDFEGFSDYKLEWVKGEEKLVLDKLPRYYFEAKEEIEELKAKGWTIFPIHGYSHSGITISLGNNYPYNDKWDGGTVGFAYLDPEKLKESEVTVAEAMNRLHSEIKELDYYMRGEVYMFTLLEWGEVIENCSGFIGDDRELRRDNRDIFGEDIAPLFDQLAYGRIDPIIDFTTDNAAMEAYAI